MFTRVHELAMTKRRIASALLLFAAMLQSGCIQSKGTDVWPNVRFTVSSGVSVPNSDELKSKIESALRHPSGGKFYAREGGKWVEVKPPSVAQGLSAVVRSFNREEGTAHVDIIYPEYRMPVVQMWWFDGKSWNDNVDAGIFVR